MGKWGRCTFLVVLWLATVGMAWAIFEAMNG